MSNGCLIGLVAETPIHAGIGQAAEALDLPVAREAVTRFPHIPGSGVKGALRIWAGGTELKKECGRLFGRVKEENKEDDGTDDNAGEILCGEARLALLPVRCTSDAYKFATCPMIIDRLIRDLKRVINPKGFKITVPKVVAGQYLGKSPEGNIPLGLEEREFICAGGLPKEFKALFGPLTKGVFTEDQLAERIVVLSDNDFKWFAEFGLPVAMRNALDEDKKVKPGALWSEETLAPDTVMWMSLSERKAEALADVRIAIGKASYIQIGGNETIGQGWFSMREVCTNV